MLDFVCLPAPCLAIPSPDLVLGAFASLAQLLGLLTVGVLGFAKTRGPGRRGSAACPTNPWPLRICGGLLVVVGVSFALYAGHVRDADLARKLVNVHRSPVENGARVGRTLADQRVHPLRMSGDELTARLAEDPDSIRIIDVREPEEVERGAIPGAHHVRYPDLMDAPGRITDEVPTLLVCFSGNRSSELCDELAALGKDVRFLLGGYKLWLADDRPLDVPPGIERRDLRDLAEYPNHDALLDTDEVAELIDEHDALVIDVRFEADAEAQPFPGAHVMTVRQMTSQQLEEACAALPRGRPVVALGYDRRSSFYASILGLRLHRCGFDFRGRYTLPHEYAPAPSGAAPRKTTSPMDHVARPLTALLGTIDDGVGHLAWSVVLLVLLLRVAVLPCSLRIDRNQRAQRAIAPLVAELDDEGRARARRVRELHAEHDFAPLRGLVATLVQIAVFVACFIAVDRAAAGSTQTVFGLPLGAADPSAVTPVLVGLLVAVHVVLGGKPSVWRVVGALAAGLVFTWLTLGLKTAVNLYLVVNLTLILAQTATLAALRKRASRVALRRRTERRRVVPLDDAHVAPGCGKKAARLGELRSIGAPVPDGFVLTETLLFGDDGPRLHGDDRRLVDKLWKRLGTERVAVRSSGLNEDGAEQSYAGVFESVLDVDRAGLDEAVREVRASMSSQRARTYGDADGDERGAALVQGMVPAEFSGVLFTEHPEDPTSIAIEIAAGLGDGLVSGTVTPTTHRFGRATSALLEGEVPPIDVRPLIDIARRVEAHFGCPQDIEWCFADGRFWIVQTRDVTALLRQRDGEPGEERAAIAAEQHRLLALADDVSPYDVLLEQDELAELLPEPTPMSLGLMQSLWDEGGSVQLASDQLGVPYDVDDRSRPYVLSAFGALYVHVPEGRARFGRAMGGLANFRLTRRVDAIADEFERDVLPQLLERVRLDEVLDLSRLDFDELVTLFDAWRRRFVEKTYVEAERINIAAWFTVKTAERELSRRGLDPAEHLAHAPETIVRRAMDHLRETDDVDHSVAMFLDVFRHRAPLDFEISAPRYGEDEALVRRLADASSRVAAGEASAPPTTGETLVDLAVERARRFQTLKEEAKHHCLRDFALLRAVLLTIAERLELGDAIFMLHPDEVASLRCQEFRDGVLALTASRSARLETLRSVNMPARVTVAEFERFDPGALPRRATSDDALVGVRISGRPGTRGRVRVLRSSAEMGEFRDGEILVGRFTDPTWAPLFPRARGIITEVGGLLSHAAIQAREYGIAGIVGAHGALDRLRTGDLVEFGGDGTVSVVENERRWKRRRCSDTPIMVQWEGRREDAELVDVARGGARVRFEGEPAAVGSSITILADAEPWRGRVVSHGAGGTAGVAFVREISLEAWGLMPQPDSFHG